MANDYDNGFNYGVKLACLMNGISESDYTNAKARQQAMEDSLEVQQAVFKIASCIFNAAGDPENAAVYDAFADNGVAIKSATAKGVLFDSVLEAMAEQAAEDEMNKRASWVTGLLGRGIGLMPDFLRGGAALSLLAGGGLGAGWWAMNRDANASSAATAAKEEQAKYYRELAKKIRRKAGKNKAKKLSKQDIKEIVDSSSVASSDNEVAEKNKEVAETLINAATDLYV